MSSPRFFCDSPLAAQQRLLLPEAVTHHAVRVLRLAAGSPLVLFNGTGGEFPATLHPEGKVAYAQLADHDPREAELGGRITLVQGLPSGDKMDWVIEKAMELGAHRIVAIAAARSVLQLSGPRLEKRLLHWQRIVRSACEQCGRNRLPEVAAPVSLKQWLASAPPGEIVMGHPDAELDLPQWLARRPGLNEVSVLVGPEGGWSDEERAAALSHGVEAVRMGSRVLRTETAGLAFIAAMSALAGWQT
jgi:16S rRNA (uracil1498-N3)-methyltransferase